MKFRYEIWEVELPSPYINITAEDGTATGFWLGTNEPDRLMFNVDEIDLKVELPEEVGREIQETILAWVVATGKYRIKKIIIHGTNEGAWFTHRAIRDGGGWMITYKKWDV